MNDPQLQFSELFRRCFATRAAKARLLLVIVFAIAAGIVLAVADAPTWVDSAILISGVAVGGTIIFVPAYREWLRENHE